MEPVTGPEFFLFPSILESWSYGKIPSKSLSLKGHLAKYSGIRT
jgi:hypothetical protein